MKYLVDWQGNWEQADCQSWRTESWYGSGPGRRESSQRRAIYYTLQIIVICNMCWYKSHRQKIQWLTDAFKFPWTPAEFFSSGAAVVDILNTENLVGTNTRVQPLSYICGRSDPIGVPPSTIPGYIFFEDSLQNPSTLYFGGIDEGPFFPII